MRIKSYLKRILEKVSIAFEGRVGKGVERNRLDEGIAMITQILERPGGACITRFGSTEMRGFRQYLQKINMREKGVLRKIGSLVHDIARGRSFVWWYDEMTRINMSKYSGFYPTSEHALDEYYEYIYENIQEMDLVGEWLDEKSVISCVARRCARDLSSVEYISLECLDPLKTDFAWVKALDHKRVLVIHPFVDSMSLQVPKMGRVFPGRDILRRIRFSFYKAPQTLGYSDKMGDSWLIRYEKMCRDISSLEFDVALIAAGSYGMPTALFLKSIGKKAIHMGGCLQLLFGLRGKRWDELYKDWINASWERPMVNEKPSNWKSIEGGCYW